MNTAAKIVAPFHQVKPWVYWTDLLLSAGVAWGSLGLAIWVSPWWTPLAALAFYRCLAFLHEITHLHPQIKGFETVWNLLVGVPLLMPSTTYVGSHQAHHSLSTYGTWDDPEYLPNLPRYWSFIILAFVIPLLLVIRFLVLLLPEMFFPRLHAWLACHASSLTMNPWYARVPTPKEHSKMIFWGWVIFMFWAGVFQVPFHAYIVWYVMMVCLHATNIYRSLAAHRYENIESYPMSREDQVLDSLDTPRGLLTELWAPVGLRYHALHHYFPGIPYHNLGAAYRRLVAEVPLYQQSTRGGWLNVPK